MTEDLTGLGKAAEAFSELTKEVRDFFAKLFGPTAEEGGQLIGEQLRFWRFKNGVRIAEQAQKILESKGIEPKAVPAKILIPLLENASLEEDENLQIKWVSLLAEAASGHEIHPSFPKILSELGSADAKILEFLFHNHQQEEERRFSTTKDITISAGLPGMCEQMFEDYLKIEYQAIRISLGNLIRLNLCTPKDYIVEGEFDPNPKLNNRFFLSSLGIAFMEVVSIAPLSKDI